MEKFNNMPEGIKQSPSGDLDFHYNQEMKLGDLSEEEIEKLKEEDFTKYLELVDREIEKENIKQEEEERIREEINKQKEKDDMEFFKGEDDNNDEYKYKWQEIFNK